MTSEYLKRAGKPLPGIARLPVQSNGPTTGPIASPKLGRYEVPDAQGLGNGRVIRKETAKVLTLDTTLSPVKVKKAGATTYNYGGQSPEPTYHTITADFHSNGETGEIDEDLYDDTDLPERQREDAISQSSSVSDGFSSSSSPRSGIYEQVKNGVDVNGNTELFTRNDDTDGYAKKYVKKRDSGTYDALRDKPKLVQDEERMKTRRRKRPPDAVIRRIFAKHLDAMSVSSNQIRNLQAMSPDEKWQMICDEPTITTLHEPLFYIRQFRAHMNPSVNTLKKTPKKKLIKDLLPVRQLLEDLKEDTNPYNTDFIKDFIAGDKGGVDVLTRFIRDTQNHIIERAKLLNADPNKSEKEQSKTHYLTVKRELVDESDCLYCLRNIADTEEGLVEIVRQPEVLETVAYCIISKALPSRLNSLRVLILACASWEGHTRVLEVTTFLKSKIKEKVRFHAISQMLTVERNRYELVTTILQFLNALLSTTTNLNRRVYLQYELELAQFDPIALEKSYGANLPPTVKTELDTWHNRYISIQALQDDLTSIKDRNQLLRHEVDIQQDKLRVVEDTKKVVVKDRSEGQRKLEEYRDRIVELQDTVENLTKTYQDKTGENPEQVVSSFDHVMRPLDTESIASSVDHTNSIGDTESVTPESSETASIAYDTQQATSPVHPVASTSKSSPGRAKVPAPPPAPGSVPAAPPLPNRGGGPHRKNRRHVSKVPMPMINWSPLVHAGNTVFKILNEDNVYKELDFTDFETTFQLKQLQSSTTTIERMKRFQERAAEQIHVIEQNRAKNMVIANRRIGLEIEKITEAINKCDTDTVPGEYAELMLKFLPTKDELKGLAQHTDEYNKLGEAERMMFQMARVDRYESKLRLMAFMGIYDELVEALIPDIESVLKASDSLIKNKKIKKMFEIILAFGNYMNSSKRGEAHGFRLDSLDKLTFVKSHDRSHTFLNYLVETVRRCYPELQGWYDELHLEHVRNVSFESMTTDIHGLRKGLELAKNEKDRQQHNTIIERFYNLASDTVHSLSDRFKKMEETYKQVCTMYGENYRNIEPVDFFKYFRDFGYQYKRASKDNLEKPISANPRRKSLLPDSTKSRDSPPSPTKSKKPSGRWKTKATFFGRGNGSDSKHSDDFSPRSPSKLSSAASSDSGVFVTTSAELESEYDSIPYSRSNGVTNNNETHPVLLKNRKILNQNNSNNNSNSNTNAMSDGENHELSSSRTYGRLVDDVADIEDDTPAVPWTSVATMSKMFETGVGLRAKYIPTPPMNRRNKKL